MNANRNLKIDFRINKYRGKKWVTDLHDHFIQKESKGKFKRTHNRFKATQKSMYIRKKVQVAINKWKWQV